MDAALILLLLEQALLASTPVLLAAVGEIIADEITRMFPYIATLLAAAGAMRRARPPRALGKPFKPE